VSETPDPKENSYGRILKSTTLVGGSQVMNILLGIVRTKFLAMLLGPAGIGMIGLYTGVMNTIGVFAGMGIGSSGVRQIAKAAGSDDKEGIARTIITMRRAAFVSGALGMLLTAVFCVPISKLTFGNEEHAISFVLLSVTLFLGAISAGQVALVQGLRRIVDLASLSVLGSLLGTVISIPMIFFLGKGGIIPFLVTVSATNLLTSWWYTRKIPVMRVVLGLKETIHEARSLLSLGFVFMTTGLITTAVMYAIQVVVERQLGMNEVGLYQAASTLSNIYIGVILNAMGMDFYPRLTSVAEDSDVCNRMVNEQTEMGLLVAIPGILATLTFTPLVIQIFYSPSFIPAYEVLRWQILGVFLRVVAWPMGFILLAKGRGKIFFCTEITSNTVYLALVWAALKYFGLVGTGMAFFALYIFYTVMMFAVVRRLSGFQWSSANLRVIGIASVGVALVFMLPSVASENEALAAGCFLTLISLAFSFRSLNKLVGPCWITCFKSKPKSRLL